MNIQQAHAESINQGTPSSVTLEFKTFMDLSTPTTNILKDTPVKCLSNLHAATISQNSATDSIFSK